MNLMDITPHQLSALLIKREIPLPVVDAVAAAFEWADSHPEKNTSANIQAALGYARSMNRAGMEAVGMRRPYDEGVKFQILYLLGNLTAWRGESAKKYKLALRRYAG